MADTLDQINYLSLKNYLSGPSGPVQVEVGDFGALGRHADDHEDVDSSDGGEEEVPEPEEGEDLLGDDVGGQDTQEVLGRDPASASVLVEVALGHPGKGLVQHHGAVHLGIKDRFDPF